MRTIKFRGKRIDNGEWVYGSYAVIDMKSYILFCVKSDIEIVNLKYEVNPETVGQFTGLLDKNGKEIYEGDVIEFEIVIVFRNGAFRIDVDDTPLQEWIWKRKRAHEETGIIGNIYENPELIKGGNTQCGLKN